MAIVGLQITRGRRRLSHEDGTLFDDALIKIDASGWGCLLLSREVLQKLQPPYLQNELGLNGDLAFFKKLLGAGFEAYADLSLVASHTRTVPVGISAFAKYVQRVSVESH